MREARGKAVHPSHLALVAGADSASVPADPLPSFDEVYDRHSGYVAGLAGRILGRNDDVPDVVQDVFLIVHRRLRYVRTIAALRTWLGRITVREASRRVRWRRLRRWLGQPAAAEPDIAADDGSAAELRPLIALLYAALDRVPAGPRVAWVLRHLLDEPLDVVAELCGCSIATAKRRIAAAEILLRPVLRDGEEETP
jgi:RNA polymerase sigma-70 factor, ECF subfamily